MPDSEVHNISDTLGGTTEGNGDISPTIGTGVRGGHFMLPTTALVMLETYF
jgi:hypothetical protein